jgi:hypothetical protein
MAITYRLTKGLPLTNAEIDDNFQFIEDELDTKLDSASYTAADVLSKLLTVDTDSAGINATTLRTLAPATANTVSTIVQRDSSGNFSAGTITASLTGNVTGDVKATGGTTVLDSGTDGTNATFVGKVNNVTLTSASTGFTVAGGTTSKTLTVSNTLTLTGTDSSSVAFGTGGTVTYTANKLSVFAATTSTELRGVISDETGSGALVFGTSPTLTTPVLGVATATSINKVAITAPATAATLTIANNKTFTANNTLTLSGVDAASIAFGSGGTVAYTGASLAQFAATTSTELRGVISDETGSGSLVFATSPTLSTPTLNTATLNTPVYANLASSSDTNIVIDAATTDLASLVVSFTAARSINISNLTAGRKVIIYIRNTNPTARVISILAGTATTYAAVNLSRSGAASVISFTAAANNGTAVVTVFNAGGSIVGSLA